MTILRTGSTPDFADGWENVFGKDKKKSAAKRKASKTVKKNDKKKSKKK